MNSELKRLAIQSGAMEFASGNVSMSSEQLGIFATAVRTQALEDAASVAKYYGQSGHDAASEILELKGKQHE